MGTIVNSNLFIRRMSVMAMVNFEVCLDSELVEKAREIFEGMGLDLPTAINIFLMEVAKRGTIPFEISRGPVGNEYAVPGGFGRKNYAVLAKASKK
jgi:addiction module RelB/DinJ family antitoxin